jgi:hypothetical protein
MGRRHGVRTTRKAQYGQENERQVQTKVSIKATVQVAFILMAKCSTARSIVSIDSDSDYLPMSAMEDVAGAQPAPDTMTSTPIPLLSSVLAPLQPGSSAINPPFVPLPNPPPIAVVPTVVPTLTAAPVILGLAPTNNQALDTHQSGRRSYISDAFVTFSDGLEAPDLEDDPWASEYTGLKR